MRSRRDLITDIAVLTITGLTVFLLILAIIALIKVVMT